MEAEKINLSEGSIIMSTLKNPICYLAVRMIAVSCFTCLPYASAFGQAPDSNPPNEDVPVLNVIDPNFAAFVAADYLPAFYPGNWEFFNYLVCYDLDGLPAAYAIIFRDPNSTIKTWQEVTAQVKKASNKHYQPSGKKVSSNNERRSPRG